MHVSGAVTTMGLMRKRTIAAVTVAAALGGTGVAVATSDDEGTEKPITGADLERASSVALEHTGAGKVTATEVGDEEGAYEVEVTRPDGSQVDVHLDRAFTVLSDVEDEEDGRED